MIELPIIDASALPAEKPTKPDGPTFWRSASHLKNDPGFQQVAQAEFLPDALGAPSATSRRQFMQLMGASVAMAGLSACRRPAEAILPYARKPEEVIPGIPLQYATAMPLRGSVTGLLVESHDGRPTKVEGNPEHPLTGGATSVFEQASVLNLYDPDRLQQVLRDGSVASWNDFIDFSQSLSAGTRIAVLAEPAASPTRDAVRAQLQSRFPQLRWVTYSSEGDDTLALGMQMAFGQPLRPLYDFSSARAIVSFDADFLGATDRNFVHNTRTFAQSRQVDTPGVTMSRLYVVESDYTVTGGVADNRLRLRSSDIPAFAAAVAARLGVAGVGNAGSAFASHPWVAALATDLQAAGSQGVVLAGETQDAAVHALCAAINAQLASQAVTLLNTGAPATAQVAELAALVQDMNSGQVDVLLTIGVNPVYDAPGDLGFAEAMGRVGETIHLGLHLDETAQAARWALPRAHYLESWGDGRAYDGTLSVIQPLIAPLYDAKSELETVNILATGLDQTAYDLVRSVWRGQLSGDFEGAWAQALHDGFVAGTAYAAATPGAATVPPLLPAPLGADDLEVVFRLDPKVLDGSFANNTWLQELPDPVHKTVWDNMAVMSPATAEALGIEIALENGQYFVDVVELNVDGRTAALPAWVLPGHADGSITVTFGYGRDIASSRPDRETNLFDLDDYTDVYNRKAVATGVGTNVAPLRSMAAQRIARGVTTQVVGGEYLIATTQDHGIIPGERKEVSKRGIFRMATLPAYQATPDFVDAYDPARLTDEEWADYPALWEENHPTDQPAFKDNPYYQNQWGMVIDLNTCTGCNACVVACQSENNIQVVGKEEVARGREMHWIRMDRYFVSDQGNVDDPQMVLQPVPCMHCENAPCESVCPVAATVHSPDGTNQMIYNRCIGTRYCANNCPYKVRRFNYYNWSKTLPVTVHMAQNPNVTVRARGVMEKCSYCIQRVRAANKRANLEDRALQTGEVKTACQQVCPAQAITFGDLFNPESDVTRLKQSPRRYDMLAELSVKPRTSYLGRVTNPNPALSPPSDA